MGQDNVYVVHLRRPRSKLDHRNDPFWEFGSFGITGCHKRNLLNPSKADRLKKARFAFVQGGDLGTRLLYLTPLVNFTCHKNETENSKLIEVTWSSPEMPFTYRAAPTLARNHGRSDFPKLEKFLRDVDRTTSKARFSSKFRSRTTPLERSLSEELIRVYSAKRKIAPKSAVAATYAEALPSKLTSFDKDRQSTYQQLLLKARGEDTNAKQHPICRKSAQTNLRPSRLC